MGGGALAPLSIALATDGLHAQANFQISHLMLNAYTHLQQQQPHTVGNHNFVLIGLARQDCCTRFKDLLGHAKLISCSMEHQRNEVGSVGRKENK